MVGHEIKVQGVDMGGTAQTRPVLLQMNDDDFPVRYLRDLASPNQTPISSTSTLTTPPSPQPSYPVLYQPVQRMLNVAMTELNCDTLGCPRVDPRRILSAGVVLRRAYRWPGVNGAAAWDDVDTLEGWMRDPSGKFGWMLLNHKQFNLDPDPTQRPQLSSGQPDIDSQLAQMALNAAFTESTTPAFAAPPATNASLNRTVVYAVVPTSSSDVSDTQPLMPPNINQQGLIDSLPALLYSSMPVSPPIPGVKVDARWMSDDFLNLVYPSPVTASTSTPPAPVLPQQPPIQVAQFQMFSLALRMLDTVFDAFNPASPGNQILTTLNNYNVTFDPSVTPTTMRMGDFYSLAKTDLLDYDAFSTPPVTMPQLTMPMTWDQISTTDQNSMLGNMISALTPKSQNMFAPQGRFQDPTRLYRLRFFFRLKPESPCTKTQLVWSHLSDPFRIAAWYESSQRPYAPISLPDPATAIQSAKPNCAFHVPATLMNAMQGTSLSGLMKGVTGGTGGAGGGGVSLGWICGFNIPLITICAFFVLNIFLMLLNIIFFWLPFIKICIPFPDPSPSSPGEGTP
jgi:hypothetical protein